MQVSLKVATALGPDSLYYNMVKKVEINISEAFIDTLMSTLHWGVSRECRKVTHFIQLFMNEDRNLSQVCAPLGLSNWGNWACPMKWKEVQHCGLMCGFRKRMPSNLMSISLGSFVRVTARDKYFSCSHSLKPLYSLSIGISLILPEAQGRVEWVKGGQKVQTLNK